MFNKISVEELQEKMNQGDVNLIDVREVHEYKAGHIKGAKNIPLSVLNQQMSQLDKDKEYYLICASGARSMQASMILGLKGYKTKNVKGGMMSWRGPVVS